MNVLTIVVFLVGASVLAACHSKPGDSANRPTSCTTASESPKPTAYKSGLGVRVNTGSGYLPKHQHGHVHYDNNYNHNHSGTQVTSSFTKRESSADLGGSPLASFLTGFAKGMNKHYEGC